MPAYAFPGSPIHAVLAARTRDGRLYIQYEGVIWVRRLKDGEVFFEPLGDAIPELEYSDLRDHKGHYIAELRDHLEYND